MSYSLSRIVLLLASTDASSAELRRFARWIQNAGASEFARAVEQVRGISLVEETSASVGVVPSREKMKNNRVTDTVDKVERLLIFEGGLSRNSAAELIRRELEKISDPNIALPEYNKLSFRSWLERIGEIVSPSLLLHVASRLRNEAVHAPRSDWPLRSNKE